MHLADISSMNRIVSSAPPSPHPSRSSNRPVPSHQHPPGSITAALSALAHAGALLKELVHDLGALGQGRPDLVPVNALGDGCAAVTDQACDVFKVDVVGAQQADEGVPEFSGRPLLAEPSGLGDRAE